MSKPYTTFEGESYTTKGLRGRGLFTIKMMDTAKRQMEEINGGFRYIFCQVTEVHRESEGVELNRFYRVRIDHNTKKVLKRLYPLPK